MSDDQNTGGVTLRIDKTGPSTWHFAMVGGGASVELTHKGTRHVGESRIMRAAGFPSGTPMRVVENGREKRGSYFTYAGS